jgi:hypothetical protein
MSAPSELDDLLAVISAAVAPRAQASARAARSRTVDALSLAEEDPVVLDLVEVAEMAQAAAALERSRNLSAAHAPQAQVGAQAGGKARAAEHRGPCIRPYGPCGTSAGQAAALIAAARRPVCHSYST